MQERQFGTTLWIDLIDPSKDQLKSLEVRFELPTEFLTQRLDPDHLPLHDSSDVGDVLVLRAYDAESNLTKNTIQGLTRKVVIFFRQGVVITMHRTPMTWMQTLFDSQVSEKKIVPELVAKTIKTYDAAIVQAQQAFDSLEEHVLNPRSHAKNGQDQKLYKLKRRVTLLKNILRLTQDPLVELSIISDQQSIHHYLDKYQFRLEEIYDNLIAILSLKISISSQKTNETMRLLTVYSLVFLPLNLIAGIYGMNFEHIPELKSDYGYPIALTVMALVAFVILAWLKKRGWLEKP